MPRKAPKKNSPSNKPSTRKPRRSVELEAVGLPEDRVRQRAYEIYCAGRNPSDPIADWFQAEHELKGELSV